jgi:hypothetical protein
MISSGLANVLSGVALIPDLVGTDLPGGSYRDRHRPPSVYKRDEWGVDE